MCITGAQPPPQFPQGENNDWPQAIDQAIPTKATRATLKVQPPNARRNAAETEPGHPNDKLIIEGQGDCETNMV